MVRMDKNVPALQVFNAIPASGSKGRWRTPLRWKEGGEAPGCIWYDKKKWMTQCDKRVSGLYASKVSKWEHKKPGNFGTWLWW